MTACSEGEHTQTTELQRYAEDSAPCKESSALSSIFDGESSSQAMHEVCEHEACVAVIEYVASVFPDCDYSPGVNLKSRSEEAVDGCGISMSLSGDSSQSADTAEGSELPTGNAQTGMIVGVCVGAAAALFIVAGFLLYRRRRRLRAKKVDESSYQHTAGLTIDSAAHHPKSNREVLSLWNDPELLSLKVQSDDIEDVRTIGSGAFGVVWLVRYRKTQLLASKRLRKEQATKQRVQDFAQEIKLIASFEHRNIAQFVGAAWTIESDLQVLLEYLEGGDLREYLVRTAARDPEGNKWVGEKFQIAVGVTEALVYVHSFSPPLVHRDLKSRNILLNADCDAKLVDFGTSRYRSQDNTMTTGVGTGRWLAPEVISGERDYGPAADIYSFGVLLSELDTHEIPYADARGANGHKLADVAILQMVAMNKLRPSFKQTCPQELRALADRCLAQDPEQRPTAPEIAYEIRKAEKALREYQL